MKYLKTFEEINIGEIEIGDYVSVKLDEIWSDIINYLNGKIGIVKKINSGDPKYLVEFEEDFPNYFSNITDHDREITFYEREIEYFSKNKKELESILIANKYNI